MNKDIVLGATQLINDQQAALKQFKQNETALVAKINEIQDPELQAALQGLQEALGSAVPIKPLSSDEINAILNPPVTPEPGPSLTYDREITFTGQAGEVVSFTEPELAGFTLTVTSNYTIDLLIQPVGHVIVQKSDDSGATSQLLFDAIVQEAEQVVNIGYGSPRAETSILAITVNDVKFGFALGQP